MKRVHALVLATALAAGFVAVGCEANPIDKTGGRSIAPGTAATGSGEKRR